MPVSQMVASAPAFTTACLLMCNTIWSTALIHGEADVTVMVRITEPFRISAVLGVYTASSIVASANEPVPLLVQSIAVPFVAVAISV